MAMGMSSRAALTETRRKKPMRRRSKKPTMPMMSASPMKCSVSQAGHTQVLNTIAWESLVAWSHVTNVSITGPSQVRHQPARSDGSGPQQQRRHSQSRTVRRRHSAAESELPSRMIRRVPNVHQSAMKISESLM